MGVKVRSARGPESLPQTWKEGTWGGGVITEHFMDSAALRGALIMAKVPPDYGSPASPRLPSPLGSPEDCSSHAGMSAPGWASPHAHLGGLPGGLQSSGNIISAGAR